MNNNNNEKNRIEFSVTNFILNTSKISSYEIHDFAIIAKKNVEYIYIHFRNRHF